MRKLRFAIAGGIAGTIVVLGMVGAIGACNGSTGPGPFIDSSTTQSSHADSGMPGQHQDAGPPQDAPAQHFDSGGIFSDGAI